MKLLAAAVLLLLVVPARAEEPGTARVRRGNLTVEITAEGRLLAEVAAEVRLELRAGVDDPKLVGLLPAGTVVAAGDVILRLDPRVHERALEQARFDLESTRAQFAIQARRWQLEAQAGERRIRAREEAFEDARRTLSVWLEVERPAAAARDTLEAQGDAQALENVQAELSQLERMYEEDELVDETEEIVLARARFNLKRRLAINGLNAAQRALRAEFERPRRDEALARSVRDREEDLEKAAADHGIESSLRQLAKDRAERELDEKAERLKEIETDLAALAIKAPAAGLLLHGPLDGGPDRRFRIGQSLDRSRPVAAILAPDRPVAHVLVPVRDALRLADTLPARLTFDVPGAPSAPGRIVRIDPLPAEGHFRLRIVPSEPVPPGLFGLPVSARLVSSEHTGVLLVPVAAVRRSGDRGVCTVRGTDGKDREVVVETGPDDGEDVIVKGGLAEGDTVVLPEDGR